MLLCNVVELSLATGHLRIVHDQSLHKYIKTVRLKREDNSNKFPKMTGYYNRDQNIMRLFSQ